MDKKYTLINTIYLNKCGWNVKWYRYLMGRGEINVFLMYFPQNNNNNNIFASISFSCVA